MSLDLLAAAASAMDAQRAALDVAARNVAAAEAAGPNRGYARLEPQFRVVRGPGGTALLRFRGTRTRRGVNVDILHEMIAVMNASRAYQADASLFDVGKSLAEQTIALERL